MPRRTSLRSQLYRAARGLGDLQATERGGPAGLAKRYARRSVYRTTNGWTAGLLRGLGLMGRRR